MRRIRLLAVPPLVLLAVLAVAPGASAESVVIPGPPTTYLPIGGAAFAGDHVVWAQTAHDHTATLVSASLANRRSTVLASAPAPPVTETVAATVRGSPGHALMQATFQVCDDCHNAPETVGVRTYAGPLHAMRAVPALDQPYVFATALAAERVAFRGPALAAPGAGWDTEIHLLDPVTGHRLDVPTSHHSPDDAAGDLLVHQRQDGAWVVVNWRTGEELYRPELPGDWRVVHDARLAPDGIALWRAYTDRPGGPTATAVTTPQATRARELQLPGPVWGLAEGRLLVAGTERDAAARVTDLEGRELARARFGAFDGRRVAWVTQVCAIPHAVVWDALAGDPQPVLPRADCPGVRVVRKPAQRNGRLHARVRCPRAAQLGCLADVKATVRRGRSKLRIGRRIGLGPGEVASMPLDPQLPQRLLRGRRTLRVVSSPVEFGFNVRSRSYRYRLR